MQYGFVFVFLLSRLIINRIRKCEKSHQTELNEKNNRHINKNENVFSFVGKKNNNNNNTQT